MADCCFDAVMLPLNSFHSWHGWLRRGFIIISPATTRYETVVTVTPGVTRLTLRHSTLRDKLRHPTFRDTFVSIQTAWL